VRDLARFERVIHKRVSCVLEYNGAATNWSGWEDPWFIHHPDPNYNWADWKAAKPGRHLIITQNLFPDSVAGRHWRVAGAAGAYRGHAQALARNLVQAGLGGSIIRLAHEANGTWYTDSIGDTPRDFRLWVEFWRKTARTMNSVPGAHFRFDWCVNAAWRPIDLKRFYPGDGVVDIIGIDAYDSGLTQAKHRWPALLQQQGGMGDVQQFARDHHKPLSIPEWGVGPRSESLGGGDDPAYVSGIGRIVESSRVAYEAYFYRYGWRRQLAPGTKSLARYRHLFG
jgi:hypothetical protein